MGKSRPETLDSPMKCGGGPVSMFLWKPMQWKYIRVYNYHIIINISVDIPLQISWYLFCWWDPINMIVLRVDIHYWYTTIKWGFPKIGLPQ